jgi:hypothetical protein
LRGKISAQLCVIEIIAPLYISMTSTLLLWSSFFAPLGSPTKITARKGDRSGRKFSVAENVQIYSFENVLI